MRTLLVFLSFLPLESHLNKSLDKYDKDGNVQERHPGWVSSGEDPRKLKVDITQGHVLNEREQHHSS